MALREGSWGGGSALDQKHVCRQAETGRHVKTGLLEENPVLGL